MASKDDDYQNILSFQAKLSIFVKNISGSLQALEEGLHVSSNKKIAKAKWSNDA